MDRQELNRRLPAVVESIVKSVSAEPRMQHLNRVLLPSRDTIIEIIKKLRQLVFPGYFGKQGLTSDNVSFFIGELIVELTDLLYEQVRCCLRYREKLPGAESSGGQCEACDREAAAIVSNFLDRIPA
ncbi:MAG TPA: hypothetical protein VH370_19640, partial [Humisphaera sp.]|nr:hypothetical protein [Humisphaera sp.]